jgi:hypothetical protein
MLSIVVGRPVELGGNRRRDTWQRNELTMQMRKRSAGACALVLEYQAVTKPASISAMA